MSSDTSKDMVIPPIKKYVMDETLSWEERYKKLEEHHIKEVTWFEKEVLRLRKEIKGVIAQLGEQQAGSL